MTQYVGGLRARLVHDNVYDFVKLGLTDLGWFNTARKHAPVAFPSDPIGTELEIKPNLVSLSFNDITDGVGEMGSLFQEHNWSAYIDVYSESDTIGLQLSTDLRDLLKGHLTQGVTKTGPSIECLDLTMATPVHAFDVNIENVSVSKSHFYLKTHSAHWYMLKFSVVDTYGTENY